jgi:hypothetical protein
MSSIRQIEANRRNSQLSTGPRTPEGKAVSRFNALKTGINANGQVIPGEDPAELEAIAAGYHQDWAPATHLECFLVDSLIRADWLLRRLARLEAELWTHHIEETRKNTIPQPEQNALLGHVYARSCDPFTRLQRRIDSAERSYFRALTQLQRLQANAESITDQQPAPGFQPQASERQLPVSESGPPAPDPQPSAPTLVPEELASFCRILDQPGVTGDRLIR